MASLALRTGASDDLYQRIAVHRIGRAIMETNVNHHHRCIIVLAITSAMLLVSASPALAQSGSPSFQGIGILPGTLGSQAFDVSPDGGVVVGITTGSAGTKAFRWTQAGGMVSLVDLAGYNDFQAHGVSENGAVIVGFGTDSQGESIAVQWSPGPSALGQLAGTRSTASAVSDNGTIIVGTSDNAELTFEAVRWSGGGVEGLGFVPGSIFPVSSALGISGNGAVIVGQSSSTAGHQAFRWTAGGPPAGLGDLPGGVFNGQANAASADGAVIVGSSHSENGTEAFRWENNLMVPLGDIPGGPFISRAHDVSADGTVVVGQGTVTGAFRAFIWTAAGGMQSLRDVLVQQGLGSALTGWVLNDASAISADGRTIVGTGTVSGHTEGWIARLPEPDTDGDGLLDDWETNGIPYTDHNSQPQRYILDVDSDNVSDAHAMRKDLFIEVDAMDTLNFDPSLFTMIEAAFAVAPISNPDLTNGIELHVVLDDLDLPFSRETPSPGGAFPPDFETLKLTANAGSQFVIPGYFGSATERALPDAAGRREARLKAFRYAIFINKMTPNSNGHRLAGQANGVPGNGMVACAGLSMFDDNHNDTEELAGTIMHEFGHLLGLSHGGLLDGTNGKPNYVSVMNYLLNRRSSWSDTLWTLDYSRAELPTLNETQLDEVQGIPSGGEYDHVQMPFGTSVLDPEGNEIRRVQYVQLDGSPVDFGAVGSVFPDGQFTSGAWQDLNYHGSEFPISGANLGQVLTGTDDWDVLSYPVPITTDSRFALAGPSEDEITEELMLAIEGMPLPLGVCPADATGDHAVNIDDLLAVISDWGPCAAWPTACNGDVAPVVGNQVVNIADLLAVIAHWGPCP